MIELTDETFEKAVLKAGKPALVDLWAPWCGPCRMMAPVIEELAAEYDGRAVVGKLNTDENGETMTAYRVSAIPTLLFFRDGKLVDSLVGVRAKADVKARLDALLASRSSGA
jgi:thioredoxin 1